MTIKLNLKHKVRESMYSATCPDIHKINKIYHYQYDRKRRNNFAELSKRQKHLGRHYRCDWLMVMNYDYS